VVVGLGDVRSLDACAAHATREELARSAASLSTLADVLGADEQAGSDAEGGASDAILTASGTSLRLLTPEPESIAIEDVALGLAREPRFSGQTDPLFDPYSVAQHAVLVAYACPPEHRLWGLLHDATEGIGFKDVPRPFKRTRAMRGYRLVEERAMRAVALAFGLPWPMPDCVKAADLAVFEIERAMLMPPWEKPYDAFLADIAEPMRRAADLAWTSIGGRPGAQEEIQAAYTPWPWRVAHKRFLDAYVALGGQHVTRGAAVRRR
jgi:hypothetical protein